MGCMVKTRKNYQQYITGQGPHLTGLGHAKVVFNEVKDQV